MITRYYPWAPLRALLGETEAAFFRRAHLGGAEWKTYRTRGLTPLVADRLAVLAGFHPAEVWPSWFDDADEDRRAAQAAYSRRYRARLKAEALEYVARYWPDRRAA